MVAGEGFPAACSGARVGQLLGPDGEQPDVVWVLGGLNDFGWGGYAAQLHGHANNAPRCVDLSAYEHREPAEAPPGVVEELERAYSVMLRRIAAIAPDAEVRCLTLVPGRLAGCEKSTFCYRLRGVHLDEYNDAIRRAAAACGARLVDVRVQGFDCETSDGSHPTRLGMRQLASLVAASLGDSAALEGYPLHLRSRESCAKSTCIGCPYAEETGVQWSLACHKYC